MVLPNGDIMCFDNGHWRSKIKENYVDANDNFSRGVIYRINTDDMTIEQVWQYGKERGAEFFSPYICNCEYYERGHYMVHVRRHRHRRSGTPPECPPQPA